MLTLKIIKKDQERKKGRYIARSYYNYKPQKTDNEINTYSNGTIHTIKIKGNVLYTNYFKMLVKQKVNYLLAKEPELKSNSNIDVVIITDTLFKALFKSSLDSRSWLHFFINNENKLDWIFVDDSEIIPVYDSYKKNIIGIIRYFKLEEDKEMYRVETWTLSGIKIEYFKKDKLEKVEEVTHYEETVEYQGTKEETEGKNLPFIPFVPMFNNSDHVSDIDGIQELIDMYNSISTGFVHNIDDFQEAITKLKGFSADSEELALIQANMRKYKMVAIPNPDAGSDVEQMAIEIPVEARKLILEILKENIFKIGQGLDPDRLAGETNLTNVVLKARYAALDMKSNEAEKQLKLFYKQFIYCINKFYNSGISDEITFNRSMVFNEGELIDNCIKSMNLLDLETILQNHPWSKGNVKKIMEKVKNEKEENFKNQQDLLKKNADDEKKLNTDDIKYGYLSKI